MQQTVFYKYANNVMLNGALEFVVQKAEQFAVEKELILLVSSKKIIREYTLFCRDKNIAEVGNCRVRIQTTQRISESMFSGCVVVVLNVAAKDLSYKLCTAEVVFYIGEENESIATWLKSREAKSIDTGKLLANNSSITPITRKSLNWLYKTCNLSSFFSHTFDKDRLIITSNTLFELGEPLDEAAIFIHCKKESWPEKAIYACIDYLRKSRKTKFKTEGRYTQESLLTIWKVNPEDMQEKSYLKSFMLESMWGYKTIKWDNINEDVNILVGINGVGKTTLLNALYNHYSGVKNSGKAKISSSIPAANQAFAISYVRTADTPGMGRSQKESQLTQELSSIIMQNKAGNSFYNYFMRQLYETTEKSAEIKANTDELFEIINEFFKETGKTITIDKTINSNLFFHISGREDIIDHTLLSSGEKQLLLILINVFLQEKRQAILMMDEPELSLHICWQQSLIEAIRRINPNCQLIITTHSPSILSKGWSDKVVYMQDIVK